MKQYVILFKGVRDVMKADKICKTAGVVCKIMPVPHIYSTECGMCIYLDQTQLEKAKNAISSANIEYEFHTIE